MFIKCACHLAQTESRDASFQNLLSKKKFKKWLEEVKKVTKLLGEARDLDVQIAFIQAYMKKLQLRS